MKKTGLLFIILLLSALLSEGCTGCSANDQQKDAKAAATEAATEPAVTVGTGDIKLEIGETVEKKLWTQTTVYPNNIDDTFVIDVCLPDSYDESIAYPVVYLTDCYWRREDYAAIKKLYESGTTKEFILVGIGYPDEYDFDMIRTRDLLHDPDSFLDLIINGVLPYAEGKYHIDPTDRTFCGASYGGYFMLYSLFKGDTITKDVFKNYVLASPTLLELSYNKNIGIYEKEYSEKTKVLNANVYMTVGGDEEKYEFLEPIQKFVDTVEKRNYEGLNLEYKIYEGKEHYTVWVPSLLDGLTKFLAK